MKTKKMRRTVLILCILHFTFHISSLAQSFELAAEGAWCWFADPRALHYENAELGINSTYIGYIDVHGAIKATQHNFNTGETSEVLIRSYFQPDDHDNPSFLALPDGRIMIFYSRHTDEACFYYRISKTAGDITLLGEEKKLATANNTTYPNPFILSNDPNHIYLCWRGINWHPTIARLTMPDANDGVSFDWGPKQIVSSSLGSSVRPYAKYVSDGVGNIHITYSGTHPQNTIPVPVYYGKMNIPGTDATQITLRDVNDVQLSNVNNGVFSITGNETTASFVVADRNVSDRGWVWDIALDGSTPVIALTRITGSSLSAASPHYYYYAKWNGSSWTRTQLGGASVRFHLSSTEYCYSGGLALDHDNPTVIYASQQANGNTFELVKYTMNATGSAVLSTENSTSGSAKNNVRPYVIPNSNNSPLRLIWMNGDYYYWIVNSSYPNGYPTSVRCDYNLYPTPATLPAPLVETLHATSFQSTNDTEILETPAISGNFTITAFIKPNSSSYSGKFFQAGDLSYNLSSRSTSSVTAARPMPNVKIASATYNSGNVFGSSDVWKNYSSTTNGSWYEPTKFDKVSLAITCKDGTLTTYINGLIDQKFDVASLTFDDVTLGGFVGEILHFAVYNTALTQNQIKLVVTDNIASLAAEEFADLQVSSVAYTDIVIPAKTPSGSMLTWTSSNPNVLSHTGLVNLPQTPTVVTLTASLGSASRQFAVTVMPRDISKNMVFKYLFDETDRYESGGASYLIDQSAKHNDARVMGNAVIDGALNLTANTNAAFSANGYLLAPDGILDSIRSYSFLMKVNLKRNDVNPRIYDFGSGSGNSVFGRANALTAGFKYNGGTTVMLNSTRQLSLNTDTYLAFTFDAKTKTTKIYMDATENSSGTAITHEPYELIASNRNYIGRTQWWSDSGQASSNTDFCGKMDDFYLFDIALAQPEIAQIQGFATGLFEIKNNKSLQIYPNPIHAGETLNFSLPEYANQNAVLQIFAVDGSMLFSQNLFLKNTLSLPIDFPHGFYFLKIQVGGQIFREKLWVVN